MEGKVSTEVLETIRHQTDIVNLIGKYVSLEKKGHNYTGLCPFHQEKKPSFTVSQEKQVFYCFGCGTGGDIYKFLMLAENLTFPEAVQNLATQAGVRIPVPAYLGNEEQTRKKEQLWKINELAKNFYHYFLTKQPEAQPARDYLAKRGLSLVALKSFQLGYAPASWTTLLDYLKQQNCLTGEIMDTGLVISSEHGKGYDRFRNRLIFPIYDFLGRVVGFGGRVLDDSLPKYLNTPESSIFNKRNILYGLNLARSSIREQGFALIVEGYLDAITAHQFGLANTVATLGTSLTEEQARLIARYTREAVIAYDADLAGEVAALRGVDILHASGCLVRVVTIREGKDPDEYIRLKGINAWKELVANALPLLEYKLIKAKQKKGTTRVILQQVLPNLASYKDAVEQEEGIRKVAAYLNLSWEVIKNEIKQFETQQRKVRPDSDKNVNSSYNRNINPQMLLKLPVNRRTRAELELLQLLLVEPTFLVLVRQELGEYAFKETNFNKIYRCLKQTYTEGAHPNPVSWLHQLDEEAQKVLNRLLVERIAIDKPEERTTALIKTIKEINRQEQQTHLLQELAEAEKTGDKEKVALMLAALKQIFKDGKPDKKLKSLTMGGK
ncbi:MAG TPA: DNA primase [Desulfotomaculum sp.]|nr:DNA primase [Desulfotomaculum sp.]HCJ79030.1 DNA primase [Desulfotomaculum sp.]